MIKYLVVRRDGTVPDWPYLVLGAKDPAASFTLRKYAEKAKELGIDNDYCLSILQLADKFDEYKDKNGTSIPSELSNRKNDPAIIQMINGRSGAYIYTKKEKIITIKEPVSSVSNIDESNTEK